MTNAATTRRSFLKSGALAAVPVAALAPLATSSAAMAADGSAQRLALLESERTIEGLVRSFVRRFNGGGVDDFGDFVAHAGAIKIDPSIRSIADDNSGEPALTIAPDGQTANLSRPARVELLTDFDGNSTAEQMARFQGHGSARSYAGRMLDAEFANTSSGWAITRLTLI